MLIWAIALVCIVIIFKVFYSNNEEKENEKNELEDDKNTELSRHQRKKGSTIITLRETEIEMQKSRKEKESAPQNEVV